MEALNSNQDNSFINRWGGEILFDNYEIIVNSRVGEDRGVEIRYGKNIKKDGISEEVRTGNTVTRIYPKAYNGYKMSGKGYVDSPLLRKYPTVKTITMTFSDVKMAEDAQEGDEEKGIIICNSQDELDQVRDKLLPYLREAMTERKIEMVFVMLTNIIEETTYLICEGEHADEIQKNISNIGSSKKYPLEIRYIAETLDLELLRMPESLN